VRPSFYQRAALPEFPERSLKVGDGGNREGGISWGVLDASGETPYLDFRAAGILAQGARVDAIFAAARDYVATPPLIEAGWCARWF
jgi:hypothetical protein